MASLDFLTPIDLHGNEARNFAHQSVSVLPDPTTRKFQVVGVGTVLYWSDGTKWLRVDDVTTLAQHSLSELGAPTTALSMSDAGGTKLKITNVADATTDFDVANLKVVRAEIAKIVDSAPALLDTLNELAAAINDDPNFANTILAQVSGLDTRITNLENGTAGALTRKFAANIGDGAALTYVLLHNLNSFDVSVSLYDSTTKAMVLTSVEHTSLNSVTVSFSAAPAQDAYRAVVVG